MAKMEILELYRGKKVDVNINIVILEGKIDYLRYSYLIHYILTTFLLKFI